MDILLQRHCARYIYVVPEGLRELMNDISREVIRSQPEDMYTFIADYLDALLITRENARVAARFVQYLSEASETIVDLLNRTGMTREVADRTAGIIQEAFRAWTERKGILKEDEDAIVAKIIEDAQVSEAQVQAAAAVIQSAFKMYKKRQQREAQLLSGIIDWRVAARSAIKLYRKSGVSPEETKRAANLIKAAYKGYYTRRAIRLLTETPVEEEPAEDAGSADTSSMASTDTGDRRKSKGVRIDYSSVVPHVDFGDEELISRDFTGSIAETEEEVHKEDVTGKTFGDAEKPEPEKDDTKSRTDDDFIRTILRGLVDSIVGDGDEAVMPIILEEQDSDIDDFVPPPVEESHEPHHYKALSVPQMSQEELDMELQEVEREMIKVRATSQVADKTSLSGEPSEGEPSQPEARPSQAEPRPSQAEPRPSKAGPRPSQAEPRPSKAEPRPSQAESQASQAEPRASQTEPRASQTEPRPSQAEPRSSQVPAVEGEEVTGEPPAQEATEFPKEETTTEPPPEVPAEAEAPEQ